MELNVHALRTLSTVWDKHLPTICQSAHECNSGTPFNHNELLISKLCRQTGTHNATGFFIHIENTQIYIYIYLLTYHYTQIITHLSSHLNTYTTTICITIQNKLNIYQVTPVHIPNVNWLYWSAILNCGVYSTDSFPSPVKINNDGAV